MARRMMQRVSRTTRPLSFDTDGSGTLLISSDTTAWSGPQFEVHRTIPGELRDAGPPDGEFALVVFLEGSVEMTVQHGDREVTHRAVPGSTSFMAGDSRTSVRVAGSAEVAAVDLRSEWLHRVDLEAAPEGFGQLPPLIADETMLSLARAMRREVETGACKGRLYGDSLSLALLSYAVDGIPLQRLPVRGALTEAQRRKLARHVRDRLAEDLTLNELSSFVGLSPRQFTRLFREAFGVTPHRYVLDQRLDEGARRLESSAADIAEIALALGFSSQSHFAAAFRKRFAQTPRQYAIARRHRRGAPF